MKMFLSLVIVVLTIIGMLDASYITYEKFSGVLPACGSGFDCGAVLESRWATIGPIPISVLGLFYYSIVFVLSTIIILEIESKPLTEFLTKFSHHPRITKLTFEDVLVYVTACGFLFSIYLLFLMGFVIKAWCLYCLISACTSTLLFLSTQILWRTSK